MDVGDQFGRLKVLELLTKSKVLVECLCGVTKIVRKGHLKDGNTSSCGCLRKELQSNKMKTHGMEGTPTYKSWNNMMMRCTNPNRINYAEYGGSGVVVTERWYKFENFLEDMGVRPDNMTLNRISGAKIYSKETCEWATYSEQSFDQRKRITNTSGKTGVTFQSKTDKWKVEITKGGVVYFIGYFKEFEAACSARREAEIKYYGRTVD